MENKEIRELAQIMSDMGLTVLDLNARGESIRLERAAVTVAAPVSVADAAKPAGPAAPTASANTVLITQPPAEPRALPAAAASALHEIKSPTVGTFYSAPEADKDPFVAVGAKISKGETLCLLEAMKMLNEITADRAGVIVEICVANKQVVEYGQTLFRIDTSAE